MDLTTTLLIILGVIVVVAIIGVVIAKSAHKGAQTGEKPAVEASEATAAAEGEPQDAEHKQEAEAQAQAVAATENKPKAEPQQTAEPQPEAEPAAQPEAAKPEAAAQPETAAQPEPVVNPEPAAKPEIVKPENSQSRLVRLRSKLAHSANPFGKALFSILSRDHLSEEDWEDVEDTLLLADVGAEASEKIVDELRQDSRAQGTRSAEEVRDMLRERLLDAVGRDTDRSLEALSNNKPEAVAKTQKNGEAKPKAAAEQTAPAEQAHPLHVIIMVGVNGTGKTTTAGKLGRLFVAEGRHVVLAAADTFRAAAADQLATWAAQSGIEVVRSDKDGADPASVAYDAAQKALNDKADVLIVDTAGRLQNKRNLMDELGKIRRVIEKLTPVQEVLLVLDATTGQNGMTQAEVFAEAIGITGVVLTKLDGSAKGGIVISVQNKLGVPVKLVGLGEGPDDLAVFDPAGFVDGILG